MAMLRTVVFRSAISSRNEVFRRGYQSENGVYGYRKKAEKSLTVPTEALESRNKQANVYEWVQNFRRESHRVAQVNPVNFRQNDNGLLPEMEYTRYGLSSDQTVNTTGILNISDNSISIDELSKKLSEMYCSTIGVELNHIESVTEREWLVENYEKVKQEQVSEEEKREIAKLMLKSQVWDNFMATKFPTVKRYGGEGAESMLAFFRQIFLQSVDHEISSIVLGMPHRGKLNLLTTMLNTRPAKMFRKFRGLPEFADNVHNVMCDIASHFHSSEDLIFNGKSVHLSMLHNPSHLEAVNPVSMGKTRSKQQTARDGAFSDDASKPFSTNVLNVQLHGDAAFAGQGINQEMLFMTGTPHYEVGGTIHMIVNNQVGFTTPGDRGRSTQYSSDLAKSINAPIFHVNVDDPEALFLITRLAFEYQREFRKDVFIDLNCFRRWGHNELDDPTFTNPALYEIIHNRKSVPDKYIDKLKSEQIISQEEVDTVVKEHTSFLQNELNNLDSYKPEECYFQKQWSGFEKAKDQITIWNTGLDPSLLGFIGQSSVFYPSDFHIHPHLKKTHVEAKLKKIQNGEIDWSLAEAMAIGSLMYQGHHVRISGEDVGRGTFSHRHAMMVDQKSNEIFIPLNSLKGGMGGKLEIANSILSEEAVLGFEYGMAIDNPHNLIIWEAQFGDFFNGAQIIIDTFIASGETKWMRSNGLVMLLPHGYDGAASEHSSCRIERFLQMTDSKETKPDGDDVNLQILNPTTPAQYFHALRRQIVRNFRKPLVIVAPKILLRLSEASSNWESFQPGTHFLPIIGDPEVTPSEVKRVILCSGKHYYALKNERKQRNLKNVALIRVESLCPFPVFELNQELDKYKQAKEFIWSQEEHRNMGAWTFVKPRFENMVSRKIKYSGRYEGATPAVGVSSWHQKEAQFVVKNPFDM